MKIGFIGVGNMAAALIEGALKNGFEKKNISGFDLFPEKINAIGISAAKDAKTLVQASDIVFLAVKPDNLDALLDEIAEVSVEKAFISIVTGKTTAYILSKISKSRLLRVMPNTPMLIGEGAAVFCDNSNLTDSELHFAEEFFGNISYVRKLPEKKMDAATALIGSGPAYVFVFIEALADAAVKEGIPRDAAYKLAAQTVAGAGKMVLETGQTPASLKDAVTSPSGTTAAALYALEKAGFRGAVMDAVEAASKRAGELSKSHE